MKLKQEKKEVCLWFGLPHEGRMRKIRLPYRIFQVAALSVFVFSILGALGAGSYITSTFSHIKNHFLVKKLIEERNLLASEKESLKSELHVLEAVQSKTSSQEEQFKAKLEELRKVIKSATNMGLVDKNKLAKDAKGAGIGGAEIECTKHDGSKCSFLLEGTSFSLSDQQKDKQGHIVAQESPDEVVRELDSYISTLKSLPLGRPGPGPVSSAFGVRLSPFDGHIKKHEGIDVQLPWGSPVRSTGDGVVREVKWNSTYGLVIDIGHSTHVSTRYAHLSKSYVKEGQKVTQGQVIGLVGSSGAATGPHLHYELRVDGAAKDPSQMMALADRLKSLS